MNLFGYNNYFFLKDLVTSSHLNMLSRPPTNLPRTDTGPWLVGSETLLQKISLLEMFVFIRTVCCRYECFVIMPNILLSFFMFSQWEDLSDQIQVLFRYRQLSGCMRIMTSRFWIIFDPLPIVTVFSAKGYLLLSLTIVPS